MDRFYCNRDDEGNNMFDAGKAGKELDEEAAATLREEMESSLQRLNENFVPGETDEHGLKMWARCEALTAGIALL